MAQIKVYGVRENLNIVKDKLSEIIHSCAVEALKLPADKKFQRFLSLDAADFYFPVDRSANYIIIEISLMEGRSVETKKHLIRLLIARISKGLNISTQDIEITLFETPRYQWGIRGKVGDELELNYKLEI